MRRIYATDKPSATFAGLLPQPREEAKALETLRRRGAFARYFQRERKDER